MATLIVGLGGTGTKIVRKLQERWARDRMPPNVGLAVIDARQVEPEGGRIEGVAFQGNQPVNFQSEFNSFNAQVRNWWPQSVAPVPVVDFSDGCGAVRPYGRFFAFRYARIIEATILNAVQTLILRRPEMAGRDGMAFEVFLVGSLGNGTGGGTFMDVAAITKQLLLRNAEIVRCYGVFIPGSVTREGKRGTHLEMRIGASGYASLLELQYEMNRGTTSTFQPRDPYVFEAWNGVIFRKYAVDGVGNNPKVAPLDYVFMLDGRDRRRLTSSYPTLLNIAAEGLAMLVGGADADARLLDGWVHVPAGQNFGSFGAARLRVPAEELLEFVTCRQSLEVLKTAASPSIEPWRRLLALASPDGTTHLSPEDVTLKDSVEFLLGKVLKILEKGANDQLINQFLGDDNNKRAEFEAILAEMADAEDAPSIVAKVREACRVIEDRVEGAPEARKAFLMTGSDSLWGRTPVDPNKPENAGIKWWLDHMVFRFVDAGALGLLKAWLAELKRQVKENKDSITTNERAKFLGTPEHRDIDVGKTITELEEQASSILAWFKKGKLAAQANAVAQEARVKFDFLIWEATLVAIESLYEKMYNYLDTLSKGVDVVVSRLGNERMINAFETKATAIARELDRQQNQRITLNEGLKAEFHVGGEQRMRDALLKLIDGEPDSSTTAILAAMASATRALLIESLEKEAGQLLNEPDYRANWREPIYVMDDFRKVLGTTVAKRVEPVVSARCTIDRILETEASAEIDTYFQVMQVGRDRIDRTEQNETLRRLERNVDVRVVNQIQRLDWDSSAEEAKRKAVNYYIAGRLFNLIGFAVPQWAITTDEQRNNKLMRYPFITFSDRASVVENAVTSFDALQLTDDRTQVKPQRNRLHDPRQVDVLVVEIGGDIESLDMSEDQELYEKVMSTDHENFCPHLTSHYLEAVERRPRPDGQQPKWGAAFLAMGEEFRFVEGNRTGNYKLARDLVHETTGKTWTAGYSLGRGFVDVIRALDGNEGDFPQIRDALRTHLYRHLRAMAIGAPDQPALGWEETSVRLARMAGEIRTGAANEPDPDVKAMLDRQDEDLTAMAAELRALKGEGMPAWFR